MGLPTGTSQPTCPVTSLLLTPRFPPGNQLRSRLLPPRPPHQLHPACSLLFHHRRVLLSFSRCIFLVLKTRTKQPQGRGSLSKAPSGACAGAASRVPEQKNRVPREHQAHSRVPLRAPHHRSVRRSRGRGREFSQSSWWTEEEAPRGCSGSACSPAWCIHLYRKTCAPPRPHLPHPRRLALPCPLNGLSETQVPVTADTQGQCRTLLVNFLPSHITLFPLTTGSCARREASRLPQEGCPGPQPRSPCPTRPVPLQLPGQAGQ